MISVVSGISELSTWLVQHLDSATCGVFQIYFYNNLFNPDKNSKIQKKKRLKKRTI